MMSFQQLWIVFQCRVGFAMLLLMTILPTPSLSLATGARHAHRKKIQPLRKRRRHPHDQMLIEYDLRRQRKIRHILGSDDSGRGCIAGPVMAATCCIVGGDEDAWIEDVDDSKRLTREKRHQIYTVIVNQPDTFVWAIASRNHNDIDETSLEDAIQSCFQESIERVLQQLQTLNNDELDQETQCYSIVDGAKSPPQLSIPSRPWKGGDEVVCSVALASILARVHHEAIMADYAKLFPQYEFDAHGGYPTKRHTELLHQHGPSPIHRLSCKPVKDRHTL